jgi:poly(3-hydroxybutyrate) depolymerase
VPSTYAAGTPIPLVLALHGGGGNASVMYRPAKAIPSYAESEGFIAVFPNGTPKPGCGNPCRSFLWGDPVNVAYMGQLLDELEADYSVDRDRIGFIGFSGGAKLIYRLAADPTISPRIRSVATVSGEIMKMPLTPIGPWEIVDLTGAGGTPMSALLVQGGLDPKLPPDGGLNLLTGDELLASFRTKVDWWRVFTGTAAVSAGVPAIPLPAGVSAASYKDPATNLEVIEVLDQNLAHAWPAWDLTKVIIDFFQRS